MSGETKSVGSNSVESESGNTMFAAERERLNKRIKKRRDRESGESKAERRSDRESGEAKSGNTMAERRKRLTERRKERQKKSINTSRKYDLINEISEKLDNIVNKMTSKIGLSKSFNIDTKDLVELYKKIVDYSPFIDGENKSRLSDDELEKIEKYKQKITLDRKDKKDIENNFLLRTIIKDTNNVLNIKINDKNFNKSINKFKNKKYKFNEKYIVKREKEEAAKAEADARAKAEADARAKAEADAKKKAEADAKKKEAADKAAADKAAKDAEKKETAEKEAANKSAEAKAKELLKIIMTYNGKLKGKKLEIKKLLAREIRKNIIDDIQILNKEKKLSFEGNILNYLDSIKNNIENDDNDYLNRYFSRNIFSELEIFKKRIKDFYDETISGLDPGAKNAIQEKKTYIDNNFKLFTYYANIEKIKIFKENNNYFQDISTEYLDGEKVVKIKNNKDINTEVETTTKLVIKGYMHYLGSILYKMKLIRTLKWDKEDIFGISFLKSAQRDKSIIDEVKKVTNSSKSKSGSIGESKRKQT